MASTSRSWGGAWRSRNSSPEYTVALVMSWRSSRTSTTGVGSSLRPPTSWDRKLADDRSLAPAPGGCCRLVRRPTGSAAKVYAQNRAGSLSPVSNDTQASGPGGCREQLQEASSVVLPAPAGADTSVSRCCVPPSSSSNSRGRGTWRSDSGGGVSLDASRAMPRSSVDRSGERTELDTAIVSPHPSYGDAALTLTSSEAEVADPVQQAVQMRLVDHRSGDGGLAMARRQRHPFERRQVALAQLAPDDDPVDRRPGGVGGPCDSSSSIFVRRWMSRPRPSPSFIWVKARPRSPRPEIGEACPAGRHHPGRWRRSGRSSASA